MRFAPLSLLALLLAYPAQAMGQDKAAASTSTAAATVTVAPAQKREIVESLTVNGTLTPRLEILVGPEIEGLRIIDLLADEGDMVKAGQTLVRLSRETLDAQLAQSDATLARADAAIAQAQSQISQTQANATWAMQDLQRAQSLLGKGSSTQAAVDQKQSAARAAQAQLQSARDALIAAQADKKNQQALRAELMVRVSRTDVKTPKGGLVARRTAKIGGVASSAGEPLFRIVAEGEIELDAEVPEQRLGELKEGLGATIFFADGTTTQGKIRLVSPEVNQTSRLGRVRIAITKDAAAARMGSYARANIELRRSVSITVPSSAVMYDGGKAMLQTVTNGAVKMRAVEVGLISAGLAEVRKGVNEGDTIIVRAGPFLRDGDAVTPVSDKDAR